jgi:hypothetical protein
MIPNGIFFECCTRYGGKFDLSYPFHRDGWLYATNGWILVRCRIDPQEVVGLNDGRKLPNPTSTIEMTDRLQGWSVPLPDVKEFEDNGRNLNLEGVRIHENPKIYLASHYIAMLRRHGVNTVKVYMSPDGSPVPVSFEGPGFEGRLMPMTRTTTDPSTPGRGAPSS